MAENPVQSSPDKAIVNSIDHRVGDHTQSVPTKSGIDTGITKSFQMLKNIEGSQQIPTMAMGMQTLNPSQGRPAAKKSSFQITRVINKTVASDNALDDVDTDELDETNTEDVSSDILDVSKTTESGIIEPDQSSEDTVELVAPEAEDALNSKELKNKPSPPQQIDDNTQPEERDRVNDVHSRFKVVKIESKEPFHRGRWTCIDFLDPPPSEKSSDEYLIGSGNSSASSSVHYVPGVDDPSKNPLSNIQTEDYPIVEPQPLYPGNYQPQSQQMTNGAPSDFGNAVPPSATQQLPPQKTTTQIGQHQGAHQSGPQLGSHVSASMASHPGGSQLSSHQSVTAHPSVTQLSHYDSASKLAAGSSQASLCSVPSSDTLPSSVSSTAAQQQSMPSQQPTTAHVLSTQVSSTQSSGQVPPPTSLPSDPFAQQLASTLENSQLPVQNASQNIQPVAGTDTSAQQSNSHPNSSIINQPAMPNQDFDSYSNGNASQANINASVGAAQSQTNVNQSQSANAGDIVQNPSQVQVGSSAQSNNSSPNNENMQSTEYIGQGRGFDHSQGLHENLPETLLGLAHDNQQRIGDMGILKSSSVPPLLEMVSATMQPSVTSNNEDESGASTVAIDNKIEQAMDLVKSHLMFAVREEVEVLKEQIKELLEKNNQLEYENNILKAAATPETLAKLQNKPQPPASSS